MTRVFLFILLNLIITQTTVARTTCSQFKNYQDAKTYLDEKKPGYKSLDKNHNGIPCEKLYKTAFKKSQAQARIRIYQFGSPSSYGNTFSTIKKCQKAQMKLAISHVGTDYSYKCEEI